MGCAQDRSPIDHTVAVRRRPTRPTALPAALLVAALALLAAASCSHDGRTLAPPSPDQTTTTRPPATVGSADASAVFSFGTDAAADGDELPARHTCDGDGVSPELHWSNVPVDATSLAIVVRDRDADGFVHWLVTGIDPSLDGFAEGAVPEGAVEQVNTTGAIGWTPPCPPPGSGRHVYDFVLHVLPTPVDIDPALPADEAARLVEDASTEEAPFAVSVTPAEQAVGSTR
jgi:Raf kinase inhibitor-like YbhB/YbcL family protein